MIEVQRGNLLEAQADALVNTVNTKGVMGKGVALQFKRRYPRLRVYAEACKAEQVVVGQMFVTELPASLVWSPLHHQLSHQTALAWRISHQLCAGRTGRPHQGGSRT